jgi:hypothetical protein
MDSILARRNRMAPVTTKTFKLTDPRDFDGNPYEVAERAVGQLTGITKLLVDTIDPAEIMFLNAYMERQGALGQEVDAAAYYDSPEYRNWLRVKERATEIHRTLTVLQRSAGYNPKAR